MALAKQITQVSFVSTTGFTNGNSSSGASYSGSPADNEVYELKIQDYNVTAEPVFYTGNAYDAALSGKLRQNFRGYRIFIDITYDTALQRSVYLSFFNELIDAFVDTPVESVSFYPDTSDKSNSIEVVLDDSNYLNSYRNTIGTFTPELRFASLDIQSAIPGYLS